jgi:flagellar basal-body rod modification protein FlgD
MSTAVTQSIQALSNLFGTDSSSTSTKASTQSSSTQSASNTKSTGNTSSSSIGSTASSQLGMDNFLTLFTTQLQYQDPTNPMDSYELAAQLAQFSTVEELTKLNSKIEDIETYLASLANAEMVNMVGKQVEASGNSIQLNDGKTTNASFEIASAANVTLRIYNEDGTLVRTQALGQQTAGAHTISWDGRNDAGTKVSNGNYTFKVEAVGADGNAISAQTKVDGIVSSVRLENGVSYLLLGGSNGIKIPATNVIEVSQAAAQAA